MPRFSIARSSRCRSAVRADDATYVWLRWYDRWQYKLERWLM